MTRSAIARAGAEYIVSADTSCLMHQQGCGERIKVPIEFIPTPRSLMEPPHE
jgi:L-lactate dehydrogenase complex protein LldE